MIQGFFGGIIGAVLVNLIHAVISKRKQKRIDNLRSGKLGG